LDLLWPSFRPDIVQAPFNILDRRLKSSGWLKKLNENNVEVQARSIFLQGLLIMNPIDRNKLFHKWQNLWSIFDLWLAENNITAIEAALWFALSEKNIDCLVLGVESKEQLTQIISISGNTFEMKFPKSLSISDLDLIEPKNWTKL
jgi:aryl-alcohol dehydrogenase-like predicted oxidoreductase